jgi:hypothetical protein
MASWWITSLAVHSAILVITLLPFTPPFLLAIGLLRIGAEVEHALNSATA